MHLPGQGSGSTLCLCAFLALIIELPAHYTLCCNEDLWHRGMRVWNDKENSGTERRVLNTSKEEAGRTDAPHPVTVLLCGGQSHGIRAVGDLGDRAGDAFGREEKAQVLTGIFLPRRSKRSLGNMRFKLIPTCVSTPEAFSNSKQISYGENFICKNTFWPQRIP